MRKCLQLFVLSGSPGKVAKGTKGALAKVKKEESGKKHVTSTKFLKLSEWVPSVCVKQCGCKHAPDCVCEE